MSAEQRRQPNSGKSGERRDADRSRRVIARRVPNRPSGLNSRTRMKNMNGSTGAVEPGMNTRAEQLRDRDNEACEQRAMKLPIPPSTTTTKAIRMKNVPIFGTT